MPDKKLSANTTTTTTTGGYCYIILPDGVGGWVSHKITIANLIKTATDAITALTTQVGGFTLTKYENKSTGFSITLAANTFIDKILLRYISGTPLVKIGTTVGGTEILEEAEVESGQDLTILVTTSYSSETVYYITITGGVVNLTTSTIADVL